MSHRRIEAEMAFFERVLEESPADRRDFIDEQHAKDADLASRLHRLLDAHERAAEVETTGCPPARAHGSPSAPERVGQYRILEPIGEGGMGMVYKAEQRGAIRRTVAVKVIKPGMDSKEILARFEAERQALAVMDHPGVARVFDAGVSETGQPFFAMEYVAGTNLIEFVRRNQTPLRDRLRLFMSVCSAVQHAHQKGVIHRDLKPSNILIVEIDGVPAPKIIDFGIAKAVSGQLSDSTLMTSQGGMIGTPEYMSPEQANIGSEDIDTRADVYSLGVVLYELLTGSLPFETKLLRAEGLAGIQRVIREAQPPRPSRRLATLAGEAREKDPAIAERSESISRIVRGDLDWIVMRCLEKQRALRYPSPGELARDIERYLYQKPVDAGPPSVSYRVGKFVKRNRVGVVAAGVIVALVLGFTLTLYAMLLQSIRAEREASSQTAIAVAVNEFLLDDLLAAADPGQDGQSVTVLEVVDRAAAAAAERFHDTPEVELQVRLTLSDTYEGLGRFDEALREAQIARTLHDELASPRAETTIDVLQRLSSVRFARGESSLAERLLERELELALTVLEPESGRVLRIKRDLALICERTLRYEDAERVLLEVYEAEQRTRAEDDPGQLATQNNLSLIYQATGRYDEAEPFALAAVATANRIHGRDHPSRYKIVESLAWLYMRQGDPASAERVLRELQDDRTRYLGAEHPDTVLGMHSLAESLRRQGRYDEAIDLLRSAEETALRIWSEDSWLPAPIQSLLGDALIGAGRFEEAEQSLLASYERYSRVLGPDSGRLDVVIASLIDLYSAIGQDDQAERWRQRQRRPD